MKRRTKLKLAAKQEEILHKSCESKTTYETESLAQYQANTCSRYNNGMLDLRPYRCPFCHKFHLTQD